MNSKRVIVLGITVSFLILASFVPAPAAAKCDRQCLVNLMQQYVAAMVKHDPKAAPLAANVKFMENAAVMPIGKGLKRRPADRLRSKSMPPIRSRNRSPVLWS